MQNVSTLIRRPVPAATAAATGLLGLVAGTLIAFGAPAAVAAISAHPSSNVTLTVASVGNQLIAHDRSEAGLDVLRSGGAEQIAHDRSEQGFADR